MDMPFFHWGGAIWLCHGAFLYWPQQYSTTIKEDILFHVLHKQRHSTFAIHFQLGLQNTCSFAVYFPLDSGTDVFGSSLQSSPASCEILSSSSYDNSLHSWSLTVGTVHHIIRHLSNPRPFHFSTLGCQFFSHTNDASAYPTFIQYVSHAVDEKDWLRKNSWTCRWRRWAEATPDKRRPSL